MVLRVCAEKMQSFGPQTARHPGCVGSRDVRPFFLSSSWSDASRAFRYANEVNAPVNICDVSDTAVGAGR